MPEALNILLCINKNFIMPATVLLESLFQNNDTKTEIYIFQTDFLETDKISLSDFVNHWGGQGEKNLHIINISSDVLGKLNMFNERIWPNEVFYRLLAGIILPNNIEKILYLDADIIINKSIIDFYNMDFDRKVLIACEDGFVSTENSYPKRLNIPDYFCYFNSGVLLFNLQLLRKNISLVQLVDIINRYSTKFIFPDQDLLNMMFYDKVHICDFRKYNFMCDSSRYTRIQFKRHSSYAAIFHFGGDKFNKPWNNEYQGTLSSLWWKYAKNTKYGHSYMSFKFKNKILKPYYYLLIMGMVLINKLKRYKNLDS